MGIYRHLFWASILALSSFVTSASIAAAEIKELSFILDSSGSQSIETLMQQAQDLAKNSLEQEFAENPDVSEVSIMVLGETNGQIVPLLRSNVSRSQWQKDSRIQRWTRYFATSSGVLLGFYNSPDPPRPQVNPSPNWRSIIENDPAFRDD